MNKAKVLISKLDRRNESEVDDVVKAEMKKYITKGFEMYNDLMDLFVKINVRDDDIKKEWSKVDSAFDNIIKVVNKKGYLK